MMLIRHSVIRVLLSLTLLLNSPSVLASTPRELNSTVLQKIWTLGQRKACTTAMRQSFSAENLTRFPSDVMNSYDRSALASALNPFLFSLGMSHTKFFSDTDEDYYFFKTLHALADPSLPAPPMFVTPGVQLRRDNAGYFVREVLDGFPAKKSGIFRGDRIVSLNGKPFSGFWGATPGQAVVEILRSGKTTTFNLELLSVNWSEAFLEATKKSATVIESESGNIGYVRLWTGTHPESASILKKLVSELKPKVKSIILDLRGGYGGAWWDHLDPFFKDSSSYFIAQSQDGDGLIEVMDPPAKNNFDYFGGPMVVLINEGVRSGKEALTYQFKKTKRAFLIGTKTPGYFTAGGFYFTGLPLDYAFYLCVKQMTLDGNEIEAIGIPPDQEVPFFSESNFNDSQISHAVKYLRGIQK